MRARRGSRVASLVPISLAALAAAAPGQALFTRASVDSQGAPSDNDSEFPVLSRDGRFVAFSSSATNLVASDGNHVFDVFVHDLATGATVRVSVSSSGTESNRNCGSPSITGDGRLVVFHTDASNLVAGDTNGARDVFVHDRDPDGNGVFDEGNGTTERVSVNASGAQANSGSFMPTITVDGRFVAFASAASNLVSNDLNGYTDVFVKDRTTGTVTCVSVDGNGDTRHGVSNDPSISDDGNAVAFASESPYLVANDNNAREDVFIRDLAAGVTTRVSVDSAGVEGNHVSQNPALSPDGLIVAFDSYASNLVPGDQNGSNDVFVHEMATATTTRVSVDSAGKESYGFSRSACLAADGGLVGFVSGSAWLVPGDLLWHDDVFVKDRTTGIVTLVSGCCGTFGNEDGVSLSLSGDCGVAAFATRATDFITTDSGYFQDIYVRDRSRPDPVSASASYGAGFAGSLGVPTLAASAPPVLGSSVTIDIGSSYGGWTVGFVFVGASQASITLPYGATLLVGDLILPIVPITIAPALDSIPLDVPAHPWVGGAIVELQVVELDPGASHGLSFTPGLELVFGG